MPKLHRGKSGNKVQNRSCLNSQSIFKMGFSMKEQNAFILFRFSSHPISVSVVDSMAAASAGLQRYYGNNIDIVWIILFCEAQGKGRAKGRPRKVT